MAGILWTALAASQPVNLADSLQTIFADSPVFTARLDNRNTFIDGKSAATFGIKAGLTWRKSFTLGLGYHWLRDGTSLKVPSGDTTLVRDVRMRYVALFAEYTFFRRGAWEAAVPVQIGIGTSFLATENGETPVAGTRATIAMYEPAMLIEYKVLNLIGLGGGLGYRLMLAGNRNIDLRFTAPVYMLRLRLIIPDAIKVKINKRIRPNTK
ncbi:MAG: hypothetical protein JNM00_11650 [Flavobacteriales bacterium]|nr:hypothetical protein [Flavobacteriales bacterium]